MASLRIVLAVILCLGLAACERIPTDPDAPASLSMQIRLPDGWHATSAQVVTVLAVRVTGPAMPPLVSKLRLIADSTRIGAVIHDTLNMLVPVGLERHFEAFVYDVSTDVGAVSLQLYAETTIDIDRGSTPLHLSIVLGPPPPPPLVRIITSHWLPGTRDPGTFFSEFAKTLAEPLGYRVEYQSVGFDPMGADLVIVPMPNADFPYSSIDGDTLFAYVQDHAGSVLFLGDSDFGGSMTSLTNWYKFYFAGVVTDTLQYQTVWEAPIVTNFGAAHLLAPGDTLIFAGGMNCSRFDTLLPIVIDTVAKLSEGGFASSDVIRFGPPAVALYGRVNGGQFVAVGDMDWIGPTGQVAVGNASTPVTTGLQVKQHRKLARLILQVLAPPEILDIPL